MSTTYVWCTIRAYMCTYMCIETPRKRAGGRHLQLLPLEWGADQGGGVGGVEGGGPFLFRIILNCFFFLSFLNKNVSIHVFFKDKKDKENKRKLLNKPQSWCSEGWLERTLVNFIKKNYT